MQMQPTQILHQRIMIIMHSWSSEPRPKVFTRTFQIYIYIFPDENKVIIATYKHENINNSYYALVAAYDSAVYLRTVKPIIYYRFNVVFCCNFFLFAQYSDFFTSVCCVFAERGKKTLALIEPSLSFGCIAYKIASETRR